jgi:hypothetical protein
MRNSAASPSTKKKELKKEFSNDAELFPSLNETLKNSNKTLLSFSAAAGKKVAEPKIVKADVAPGWVHIRKHNGQIEYKYGAPIPPDYNALNRREMILGNLLFDYRMSKEQYQRDMDVLRLGDLSKYYDAPTLAELHEIEMQYGVDVSEESDQERSDYFEEY